MVASTGSYRLETQACYLHVTSTHHSRPTLKLYRVKYTKKGAKEALEEEQAMLDELMRLEIEINEEEECE